MNWERINKIKLIAQNKDHNYAISYIKNEIYQEIIGENDKENLYWMYISISIVFNELNDFEKDIDMLQIACRFQIDDYLSHIMLSEKYFYMNDIYSSLCHLFYCDCKDDFVRKIANKIFIGIGKGDLLPG